MSTGALFVLVSFFFLYFFSGYVCYIKLSLSFWVPVKR